MRGYYFITDAGLSRSGNISDVKAALAAKVEIVQYRDKHKDTKELFIEALKLRAICQRIKFLINDRVDIALAVEADGVHLGREDLSYRVARRLLGKKRIIGLTVHNIKEALAAEEEGADYIGVSPVFATLTKFDAGRPCGTGLIRMIKKRVSLPIVAIGGIDLLNGGEVVRAGADCICAVSAVVAKRDVKREIERFQELF
ncbi:MAG: thiamine phosphate synthase [Candidatus Omnitrophica bacterium]|nr:thiamine phosphate synthase [Candidatus Omnitrophota bacterium]